MFKVSAVPPRRSAMLTVFRGATAINGGTTAEPMRPWRCNYGLCRTRTAVAPRLRCDWGRRSAVMTILRDATAINDGTTAIMAVSLRNHGDIGGATAVYAVQAPQWYRASGVTGVLLDSFRLSRQCRLHCLRCVNFPRRKVISRVQMIGLVTFTDWFIHIT